MTSSRSEWIFVSAGEVSGDIHSAGLISEINKLISGFKYIGIGGDNLRNEGVEILYHIKDIAFIGFIEIVKHIPFFKKILKDIENLISNNKPTAAILVDYPGFNLKLAELFKKYNVPVYYYISPQVWAWGKRRVKKIKKFVDQMAVLFDFEEEFYRDHEINTEFIGHPLVDKVKPEFTKERFFDKFPFDPGNKTIGILPGSRTQEVLKLLPPLLDGFDQLRSHFKELQAFVSVSPTVNTGIYESIISSKNIDNVIPVKGLLYDIMSYSDLLFVASGTATVESAIAGTPMIVVYKIAPVTYILSRLLVSVKNFGMVNIIAGKEIVPELLQNKVNAKNLSLLSEKMLSNQEYYKSIKNELKIVHQKLGEPGASARGAKTFVEKILQT
ncbi:lipid-A-disaccharide synthase [candidate division KSB1 bacterium]